jgi:hypothetical protein
VETAFSVQGVRGRGETSSVLMMSWGATDCDDLDAGRVVGRTAP